MTRLRVAAILRPPIYVFTGISERRRMRRVRNYPANWRVEGRRTARLELGRVAIQSSATSVKLVSRG